MQNKEEIEKAKEKLKKFCDYEDNLVLMDNVLYEYQEAIKTLLQYIDQLEQENNKLNKMIDEMAKELYKLHNLSEDDCFIPREYSDINDCVKKASCEDCIKQYFEEKVEEE